MPEENIARDFSASTGQSVGELSPLSARVETGFGPANDPDWTRSDWYRLWVELATKNNHFFQ
jgi:hypothetical protein